MRSELAQSVRPALALVLGAALALTGCGGESTQTNSNAPPAQAAAGEAAAVPTVLAATDTVWTPEEMEDLLAPVALYPDEVLGNVLVAATNPQEVLDAGNWRLQNESLEGAALDDAAKKAGFTPPARVLVQNPVVLDMMSSEIGWTTELGQAYVNDQAGALDAVQRLRLQARDVGNLESSDKLDVTSENVNGTEYVYVSSPDPEVVYVPQYDPEAVYEPVEEDKGHSTGTLVATGLLAFGAGLVVANLFHDDDDDDWYDDDYYYPRYYGEPMPYYAHYPYRPAYGGPYRPSTAYVRPPNYRHSYTNNTVVVRRRDNDVYYWDRYDDRKYTKHEGRHRRSPITRARPDRPELVRLNDDAMKRPKRRPADGSYGKGRDKSAGRKGRDGDRARDGKRDRDGKGRADFDRDGRGRDGDSRGGRSGGKADRDRGGDRKNVRGGGSGGGKAKGGGGRKGGGDRGGGGKRGRG